MYPICFCAGGGKSDAEMSHADVYEERDESIAGAPTESQFRCTEQTSIVPSSTPAPRRSLAAFANQKRADARRCVDASGERGGSDRAIGLQMCVCRPHCAMTLKQPPVTNATLPSLAAGSQRSLRVRSPEGGGGRTGGSPVWPAYLQHTEESSG